MNEDILEIANQCQFNAKAEAQAIFDYDIMIMKITKSSLEEKIKKLLIASVKELISDELNHAETLAELYTMLTDIEANKS